MNPDAAIFARLTQQGPGLQPDPVAAAHRMTEAAQELTSLIRQASACVSELRLGRQVAVMRLPILLARAEDAVTEQHRCSHILARAFSDPA